MSSLSKAKWVCEGVNVEAGLSLSHCYNCAVWRWNLGVWAFVHVVCRKYKVW